MHRRAYEYACATQLYKKISVRRNVDLVNNSSLVACEKAWRSLDTSLRERFIISANAAIDALFDMEPLILENEVSDTLQIMLQSDTKGEEGDVRDRVINSKLIMRKLVVSST